MSRTKAWLEDLSVEMGLGGEINDDVLIEGQKRMVQFSKTNWIREGNIVYKSKNHHAGYRLFDILKMLQNIKKDKLAYANLEAFQKAIEYYEEAKFLFTIEEIKQSQKWLENLGYKEPTND